MADTLFADISSYQPYVNDSYPYRFLSFRACDGTYRDPKFSGNLAWAKAAVASDKITGFIVYFVWEPNWQQTVANLKAMVGTPHPRMAIMIDVESWSGRITGDHSAEINATRENLIAWLGGNRKRVIGYANAGDFAGLWPTRGDCKVILANYSSNPAFPNKIAHQFSSTFACAPFGLCDINSADGYSPEELAVALGLAASITKPSDPSPKPVEPPKTTSQPLSLTGVDRWGLGTDHLPGTALTSGKHQAIFQTDGNFVLYHAGKAAWQSNTRNKGATRLSVQADGNVVIYAGSKPLWYTRTQGNSPVVLIMQINGALTLFNATTSKVLWTHS